MKNYSKRTNNKVTRYRTPSRRLAISQATVRRAQLLSELQKRDATHWNPKIGYKHGRSVNEQ